MSDETSSGPAGPSAADHDRRRAVRRWWQNLQPLRSDGTANPNADRAALARLRRASSVLDILDEAVVFSLHRALGYGRARAAETLVPVAVTAAVLAHVRAHDPAAKPARVVGRASLADHDYETACLSPLRLKRLLQAREPDDLLRQMRRLVALADRPLDVGALALLILGWADEERGPRIRSRFAYEYHAAAGDPPGSPAPLPDGCS
ncbi:type I-E CRISPR-associated protein Cse2/CasB [Methylobacterium nodulans]|uniref:CRISPR-associated protein, Cse2 family n=1 Tax=Methylobacterium nodulans (strain LMG 21967 / CNCM I-2342 / ORS 2060) TaxID=460265 RepID=B8IMR4_METNO|nr:type I-E CRISPR-associated protein Cse2/CasB [Methylobacterium nodulans]ACL60257.1 CRISPR-associated protein, Cse2 family [Methylobacterium nodulans ORS 2060]